MTPWQPVLAVLPLLAGEFSALPSGDVIEVHVESNGCFHSTGYKFKFRGGETLSVSLWETGTDLTRPEIPPTAENTRPVTLTAHEAEELDAVMGRYQSIDSRKCIGTTTDWVSVVHTHAGKVVSIREFKDESCGPRFWLGFAHRVRGAIFQRQSAELRAASP